MTLISLLVNRVVAMVRPKPRRQGRRHRVTAAMRRAAQEALTEELGQQLQERNDLLTRERNELAAKAAVLPEGVNVVSGQEGA